MDIIPADVKLEKLWRTLPYEDINRLCLVNQEFNLLCQRNSTWEYLVNRDFGINYTGNNARNLYIKYRQALDYFSSYYPIITYQTLALIVDRVPISWRDNIGDTINRLTNKGFILSVDELIGLIDETYPTRNWNDFKDVLDPRKLYNDFDKMIISINQNGCDMFMTIVTTPTLIFVNKIPIMIKYDYDLAKDLWSNIRIGCNKQFNEIINYILNLR